MTVKYFNLQITDKLNYQKLNILWGDGSALSPY